MDVTVRLSGEAYVQPGGTMKHVFPSEGASRGKGKGLSLMKVRLKTIHASGPLPYLPGHSGAGSV